MNIKQLYSNSQLKSSFFLFVLFKKFNGESNNSLGRKVGWFKGNLGVWFSFLVKRTNREEETDNWRKGSLPWQDHGQGRKTEETDGLSEGGVRHVSFTEAQERRKDRSTRKTLLELKVWKVGVCM